MPPPHAYENLNALNRRSPRFRKVVLAASFPPIEQRDARVLVLGSLPGPESLRRQEYYAHSRNAFWRIMTDLCSWPSDLTYAARTAGLTRAGVALWDVCGSAFRAGALDVAIQNSSIKTNDFAAFLTAHRSLGLICFNGTRAEAIYRRRVLPGLSVQLQAIRLQVLPSTSPANATMPYAEKLRRWSVVKTDHKT
jgi:hypoxanthine-DNA glycosylase